MFIAGSSAALVFASVASATMLIAPAAFSQAPTEAQRAAIRSACRADYEAHCASIPPGGAASLQCLQKNLTSLSPPCQSAVRAVEAPSESKAEPAPPAPPEKTEAAPAAEPAAAPKATATPASPAPKQPTSAQIGAMRSACRSDYPKVCAGVPTGGAPALQCLEKNKSKVSASCQKAIAAATGGTAAAAGAPTAAPAEAPPVLVLRPMLPREELFVLRSACGADVRALCAGVAPGGGRIIQCLVVRAASLSADCRAVLSEFAAR
jgi:cysteine rich repeat protein